MELVTSWSQVNAAWPLQPNGHTDPALELTLVMEHDQPVRIQQLACPEMSEAGNWALKAKLKRSDTSQALGPPTRHLQPKHHPVCHRHYRFRDCFAQVRKQPLRRE